MVTFDIYSEDYRSSFPVFNNLGIDLGVHASDRADTRLSMSKDSLLNVAKKIARVFQKSNPDGLFGFYSKEQHVSGIFRFFKNSSKIKFVTIFPDKKVQFFNNINGMLVFNEELGTEEIIKVIEV